MSGVSGQNSMIAVQHEGRRRFLELVADLRPELHRYCARMTGSVADGEDIVQETLARAYYLLPEMDEMPAFRPWLFRIAHNRALDHLRRYEARMGEPLEAVQDSAADPAPDPGDAIAHEQAVQTAVSHFVELAPAQRSCVILKDVLGHSMEEIGGLLELSLPAVKSALHRGRAQLRELAAAQLPAPPPRQTSPAVARYVALFNARDWDGVRAMLAEDVQLDLVSRAQRAGRAVGNYMTSYDSCRDWRLAPAWLEGREVIAVFRAPGDARPDYFIELGFGRDKIRSIRDFRYVPYVMQGAAVVLA
ncbi:MAG TPA: sigma-70 family RNA polymerase sigma factor [Steroidobacteraceae bacterium]|nr:sigma-70 family RNA polymerase sigma factor [Steroidobacteraceae bacterium]